MADELEGCECVWSHEMAMRRLLYLIRQTQTTCTDTECADAILPMPSTSNNSGESFTMMTMFVVLAVILYFLRPSTSRPSINPLQKDNADNDREDSNNDRPPPAVY